MEHICPLAKGGTNAVANLALSCSGCNGHKYDKVESYDNISEQIVPLFHPRQDRWSDHFAWHQDYTYVVGITPTGRATVYALCLNRQGLVNLRGVLFQLGLHPPAPTQSEAS